VSHNEAYDALQKEYLKNRDGKTLGKMYRIAEEASYNYLRKYCRKKGIWLLNIKEMSHDASVYIIDQYLRKTDFRILKLSAYIHFGVRKTLFNDKDAEMREISYENIISNGWDKRISILNVETD
jgi:hypothetical protein